jgi:hypothetical protein
MAYEGVESKFVQKPAPSEDRLACDHADKVINNEQE